MELGMLGIYSRCASDVALVPWVNLIVKNIIKLLLKHKI